MIIRSLLIIIALIISGKYLGKLWNKETPGIRKWILRLAIFCIAFFLPLYRMMNMHGANCVGRQWLLPLMLSAGVLYTYFLWPTNKDNCCGSTGGTSSVQKILGSPTGPFDNLKKIEGIGPKIEQLLHSYGITTFETLAATDSGDIKQMLVQGGDNFKNHDPSTRPMQSQLAASGKWEVLATLQEELKGGKFV